MGRSEAPTPQQAESPPVTSEPALGICRWRSAARGYWRTPRVSGPAQPNPAAQVTVAKTPSISTGARASAVGVRGCRDPAEAATRCPSALPPRRPSADANHTMTPLSCFRRKAAQDPRTLRNLAVTTTPGGPLTPRPDWGGLHPCPHPHCPQHSRCSRGGWESTRWSLKGTEGN